MAGDRSCSEALRLQRLVAVVMFVVGGLLCVNGALFTQETATGQTGQGLVAGGLLACAALLAATRPRLWLVRTTLLVGIGLMSCLVATAAPLGTTPFFYLWPLVYTAYFDGLRMRVAAGGWMALTLAVGLAVNSGLEHRADMLSGTLISVGVITWLVSTMRDRDRRQEELLVRAAETDHLTGLLNRRAFEPELRRVLESTTQYCPTSVVMFDVDHFKSLNDEWGHLAGDHVLERMADALRHGSRGHDSIARFGGDEFVVALADCDATASEVYASRVVARLRELQPLGPSPVAVSYGAATVHSPAMDSAAILTEADRALYEAKAERSSVAVST